MDKKTKKTALYGMLVAAAFILSWLESFLPVFFGIPGIKPGFSNMATLVALYTISAPAAIIITLVRVLLSGFTFGSMYSVIYGLAGAVLSLLAECIMKKTGKFGVVGISVTGGVMHNAGQILVALAVVGNAVVYYFPFLVAAGVLAGILTGVVSGLIIRKLPKDLKEI